MALAIEAQRDSRLESSLLSLNFIGIARSFFQRWRICYRLAYISAIFPHLMPPPAQPQETLWEDDELVQPKVPVQHLPDERESRLIRAMKYVHEHGVITNKVYRDLTGASERTAHRDLELLVERHH